MNLSALRGEQNSRAQQAALALLLAAVSRHGQKPPEAEAKALTWVERHAPIVVDLNAAVRDEDVAMLSTEQSAPREGGEGSSSPAPDRRSDPTERTMTSHTWNGSPTLDEYVDSVGDARLVIDMLVALFSDC